MTAVFLAGVVAGYGVAIPVGAIAVLILGLTARTSLRVGAAAALGVATADGIYAGAAALGGAAVAAWLTPLAGPLRLVAAAVLLALAAHGAWRALPARRSARAAVGSDGRPSAGVVRRGLDTPLRAFAGVLALTMLNPATVVYFTALVLGRRDLGGLDAATGMVFALGAFVASASWQLLVAGGGSLIGRALTSDRGRLVTALLSSTIIAALAVGMLLSG
ncbi:Arginine exporter protein ArgO [Micromonospora phaseoli]|uniref:Arginine exporter protein ArgO n=1 Tax=Micromonospora phaseoli TaxID=1144548 RepID=A0A1H7D729_9ACTN|nr:LysE family transporter [Micromonospora phaseoli]PZV90837.1 arginine exporter protein ArgO [Micromonospora phaseoli]GIJ77496.1 lysine transporter LysE [Micromonospora phaseoli]SEJ97629.1 Arginine exporter protein ArgO [Micromonospora phaseoli]